MKLSPHLCFLFAFLITGAQRLLGDEKDKAFGIDQRVPWTTSRITGSPEPPPPYEIERVYPKLTFQRPVELIESPESKRLFVVEVDGRISSFEDSPPSDKADLAIDFSERGVDKKMRIWGNDGARKRCGRCGQVLTLNFTSKNVTLPHALSFQIVKQTVPLGIFLAP